mmetsp:Transcript_10163/g.24860  ORF Transcript_10163/g.24860 Transcript_10163/m.24860 type:complete len:231 (+) Transcript_10163:634-1326(+)
MVRDVRQQGEVIIFLHGCGALCEEVLGQHGLAVPERGDDRKQCRLRRRRAEVAKLLACGSYLILGGEGGEKIHLGLDDHLLRHVGRCRRVRLPQRLLGLRGDGLAHPRLEDLDEGQPKCCEEVVERSPLDGGGSLEPDAVVLEEGLRSLVLGEVELEVGRELKDERFQDCRARVWRRDDGGHVLIVVDQEGHDAVGVLEQLNRSHSLDVAPFGRVKAREGLGLERESHGW